MRALLALIALSAALSADEIVLKDGRRIEWRSLEDSGETYAIVTPEGGRVVVRRSDVEGFAKTEPAVALTGAAVTFDKRAKVESVDLLKRVDTEKDFLVGIWKLLPDGSIQSTAPASVENSCLQIRYATGQDEYNLSLTIERTEGADNIGVSLPVPGGRQCQFFFDVDSGKYSAVLAPGGQAGHAKLSTPVAGRQFPPKKPRLVTFMVRRAALVVQIDGRDLSATRIDWTKVAPITGPQARDGFAVSALTSGVKVSKMVLTVLKQ